MSRQQQKAETRARILAAARELFREVGFERTTIARIARQAGVANGTVISHFADKSVLVADCFRDDIDRQLQRAWESCPDTAPTVDQLLHLAHSLYLWYAQDWALGRDLVQHTLFLGPPEGDKTLAQVMRFVGRVAERIAAGQATGQVRSHGEPMVLAQGYFNDYFAVLGMGLREQITEPAALISLLEPLIRSRLDP